MEIGKRADERYSGCWGVLTFRPSDYRRHQAVVTTSFILYKQNLDVARI